MTGTAATLLGQKPALMGRPEETKAILITGAMVHRTLRSKGAPGPADDAVDSYREGYGTLNHKWSNIIAAGGDGLPGVEAGHTTIEFGYAPDPVTCPTFAPPLDQSIVIPNRPGRTVRVVATWGSHQYSGLGDRLEANFGTINLRHIRHPTRACAREERSPRAA